MPLLSYPEAAKQILGFAQTLAARTAETVPLAEAFGRVLATPLHADRDQPPFPRSTRDGYACRAADSNTHQPLHLAGQVRAGQSASSAIHPGDAWEIMTGAPVPEGADAVFMLEHAEVLEPADASPTSVRLREPRTITAGENIVPRAAEARLGDALLLPGARITAAQIALAAQCGYPALSVYKRPRVAILSTGDELAPIESTPGPSQIRNSNSPMLAALVAAAGGEPVILPTVADSEPAVDAAIQSVLAAFPDMVLITGGISAGRFDLVQDALTRAGAYFTFHGIAIQPGKPVAFGHVPISIESPYPIPVLALPGNPISSAITFHIFAAPLLAALSGNTTLPPRFASASLIGEWQGKPGLTRFLPAHCDFNLSPRVGIIPWQGSGDLAAFARSNCALVIPPDADTLPAGAAVQILLFDSF